MTRIFTFLFQAPPVEWVRFSCFFVGIFIFILIAEKSRTSLGWAPEVNRKLVHILTGILIFFTPYFFTSSRPLIWMAVIFIIVNAIGIKTGKLKGMHDTARATYGTVFYPLTFLFLVITCWEHHKAVLMLSMLILAISDATAAIVGENIRQPHMYRLGSDKKSFEGSAAMFITSFFIVFVLLPIVGRLDGITISLLRAAWIGWMTAIIATALEAISSRGSDNLSAPIGAAFVLSLMIANPPEANVQWTIGVGLALIVAVLSYSAHFLTASGSLGTFLLAALIFGTGGWIWSVPILTFFIFSSLLSKIGKTHKAQFGLLFEKSSRRDIGQVLANGFFAGVIMLLYNYYPHEIWYVIYLGALAAVTADTWATEIGVFSNASPRLIIGFKSVSPGTSGGITILGTIASVTGAVIIAISGWIIAPRTFNLSIGMPSFWIIVGAGTLASLVDSILGATVQAQYRCPKCAKITEKKRHCDGLSTRHVSGAAWLSNDCVNAFCSLSGAVIAWAGWTSMI